MSRRAEQETAERFGIITMTILILMTKDFLNFTQQLFWKRKVGQRPWLNKAVQTYIAPKSCLDHEGG
jgi:hypothetical protein